MTIRSKPLGLYLHIPFCHARCGYCDFVTFTGKEDQIDRYVQALYDEIKAYDGSTISTIFFGGGTPSVLEGPQLRKILSTIQTHLSLQPGAEITLEANPESITLEKLQAWRSAGVNRLSIGLQAYDDVLLKSMGRLHTVKEFENAYQAARAAGFSNLNIDLIYGFPGQTLSGWTQTLRSSIALKPAHISLYALGIEEHTPFGAAGVQVDVDLQAEMYATARAYLPANRYGQYEISNFAQAGKECRHNLIYWRGENYLGLGVGAVGCVDGLRWENQKNLPAYYRDLTAGRLPRQSEERLDAKTQKFERLMLGLRLREGLRWDSETDSSWLAERSKLASKGLLEEILPGTWRIPDSHVALTNQILLPFLPA
jgi:oxygen-independent coproporphyrinogen-3 oxidase